MKRFQSRLGRNIDNGSFDLIGDHFFHDNLRNDDRASDINLIHSKSFIDIQELNQNLSKLANIDLLI